MRRTAIALFALVTTLTASAATAQMFKQDKDGNYEVSTPQGKVTVSKDGKILNQEEIGGVQSDRTGTSPSGKTLELGKASEKKPRTKQGPKTCDSASDVLVEHAIIEGADIGVAMVTSCDADVFNTKIEAKKHGIDVVGSGELRLSHSEISGGKVGVNVTGSGDAIIEDSVIVGPVALNLTGTGNVRIRNSKVYGKIVITGTGKVVDEGGNTLVKNHTKASKEAR